MVRQTYKAKVRQGLDDGSSVKGMVFTYDAEKVEAAIAETYKLNGIFYVRAWLNEGQLEVGDDIMYVLIGGDIRPHVIDALQFLVEKIKTECVTEIEKNRRLREPGDGGLGSASLLYREVMFKKFCPGK